MDKSPEAFRTISEVAEVLDTPAHVLRFWETRFPQIRPVKRAGGRRYYRPSDVALLSGIKRLLHEEGLTIRGVQKILREQGIRHVSGLHEPEPGDAALEAAIRGRMEPPDTGNDLSPEHAASATAEALEAALEPARGAEILHFPQEIAAVAPAAPLRDPETPETATTAEGSPTMPDQPPPVSPTEEAPPPSIRRRIIRNAPYQPDLFGSAAEPELPLVEEALVPEPPQPAAEPAARPVEQAPVSAAPVPEQPAGIPARKHRPATTLAGRLRALPHGNLQRKKTELRSISARIALLREKLRGDGSAL